MVFLFCFLTLIENIGHSTLRKEYKFILFYLTFSSYSMFLVIFHPAKLFFSRSLSALPSLMPQLFWFVNIHISKSPLLA